MYLAKMTKMRFPHGLLANLLLTKAGMLQTICFQDNEYGARVTARALLRVRASLNRRLQRAGKALRITHIEISDKAHHQLTVSYLIPGNCDPGFVLVSPYAETRRQRAAAKAEAAGDTEGALEHLAQISGPRRGAAKVLRGPRKRQPVEEIEEADALVASA